jgi:TPR repeat protein
VSSTAAAAYRARDYAALVRELRPLAERRQPVAMAALASLYARGLGVERDMRQAEQLWQRAADLGHVPSRANLEQLKLNAAKR